MRTPIFQVDAFADRLFTGNPAAVCPLPAWPADELLQLVAAENNLSETAFLVREGEGWRLRWFTPAAEVDLCGHATLAAAFVVFTRLGWTGTAVPFETRSGRVTVTRAGDLLSLDFPALPPEPCAGDPALAEALGVEPAELLRSQTSYLAVLPDASAVAALAPDMAALLRLTADRVIVTAPGTGDGIDFVSRFFAPALGVPEDPVTGSAHCTLAPFWGGRLGKTRLRARQISRRGGEVLCELKGDRVVLSGGAVLYLEGEIRMAAGR